MFLLIAILGFLDSVFGQTCQTPTGIGQCLGTMCPTGYTCLTGQNICCLNSEIQTTTTAAPTTTTRIAAVCVDLTNPATGVSDCPGAVSLCNNALYFSLMTQQCPKTCGRCSGGGTSTTCVDLTNPATGVSDCPGAAYLCNNALYLALMTQQCPKTCGRCSSTSTSTGSSSSNAACVDLTNPATGVSDCPSRVAYCNNQVYFSLMTQQCPKTCGRCTSG